MGMVLGTVGVVLGSTCRGAGWLHGHLFLGAGRAWTLGFPLDVLWSQPELQPSSSLARLIFSHQSKNSFLEPCRNSQDPRTAWSDGAPCDAGGCLQHPLCNFQNFYLFIYGCAGSVLLLGLSLVVACGCLIVVASLVAKHGLQGTWAQWLWLEGVAALWHMESMVAQTVKNLPVMLETGV